MAHSFIELDKAVVHVISLVSVLRLWFSFCLPFGGFPGGSVVKNPPANEGDLGLIPGSGKSPKEGNWLPTPLFLPGEFHGQRSLVGHSPRGCKESDMTE